MNIIEASSLKREEETKGMEGEAYDHDCPRPQEDGRELSQRRPVIASNSCLFRSTAMRVSKLL